MASPSDAGQPPSDEGPHPGCQVDGTHQEQQEVDRPGSVGPEQRGGYDCEFVERPQELQVDCPICLVVLCEPFQVTCCGYSFCQTCIEHVLTNKKACPTCNEASFSAFANKGLRRSLYAFQVWCVHKKSGCEWTGELVELDRHLNLNPELGKQLIGCAFAVVACTHCRKYFQRHHVHAHESEACPQRPFSCDYCKDYDSVYEDVVNSHWPVCKWYPVPCPNECGVRPERQNVATHVNTVCPLTVINCDFHYAGCEVQLVRKDVPTHLAESLLPHLSLLALHNQQLTQLTMQQKESLEKSQRKIQELEREKQTSKHENEALLAQLTKQQKEDLKELRKETEVLKLKVNKDVEQEVAELRKQVKESLEESQRKIQELERKKQKHKHEIEALKQKVNKDMRQEMAEVKRQRDEDRASLVTLQHYVGVLPPVKIEMTNFEKMKKNSGEWYSPPFYTHPQGYKMCLKVDANGKGVGKGTHVSVFVFLMRGEFDDYLKWPFQGIVVLQLCNQLQDKYHYGYTIDFSSTTDPEVISRVTSGEQAEIGKGTDTLIAHNDLNFNRANNFQYLKNDCLYFQIIAVESRSEPGVFPTKQTMTNFERYKINRQNWYSPPFYTHPQGYKMCVRVSANGDGSGRDTHVSVFVNLMRGEFDDHLKWPFRGDVTVAMLNQLEDNHHITKTTRFTETADNVISGRVTGREKASKAKGQPTFIAHTDLKYNPDENCHYLKYDCLCFQIVKVELK